MKYHYKNGFISVPLWDSDFSRYKASGFILDFDYLREITVYDDFVSLCKELESYEITIQINVPYIKIRIIKIIDTHQPGFVECQFTDAWGVLHIVHEKIPVVTCEDIWTDSRFPADGMIRCKAVKDWLDDDGRKLITVSTQTPDCVEATTGINEFDLLTHQLIDIA